MRLALYQPDIPQNAGTLMRLGACLGVAVDVIEPAGFLMGDRAFRRAGLDYVEHAAVTRHASFESFEAWRRGEGLRLVLLSRNGEIAYWAFAFRPTDVLLVGRESSGAPEAVHRAADARLRIPVRPGLRSLNVAVAAAMVLGEALRQTSGFPGAE